MPGQYSSPLLSSFGDERKCKPPPWTCENKAYSTDRRSAFRGDTSLPLIASRRREFNFRERRNGEVRRIPIPRTRVNKGEGTGTTPRSSWWGPTSFLLNRS